MRKRNETEFQCGQTTAAADAGSKLKQGVAAILSKLMFVRTRLMRPNMKTFGPIMACLIAALAIMFIDIQDARAEYGDVVINNYSDTAGMRPVVFPHWFHRVRFRCKVCHADLGFKFQAGGNEINMVKIIDGQFCGACHNGEIAWSVENCNLCHSAKPGTKTQVHESTIQKLAQPAGTPAKK